MNAGTDTKSADAAPIWHALGVDEVVQRLSTSAMPAAEHHPGSRGSFEPRCAARPGNSEALMSSARSSNSGLTGEC
jgi:hypothetical protein